MTMREYLENISSLAKEFPEVLDYVVVSNKGGFHDEVEFYPHPGLWQPKSGAFRTGTNKANAICIN